MKLQFIFDVYCWIRDTFGEDKARNKENRSRRFIEEAIELVQASDMPKSEVQTILDYVYSRPKGEITQEVGGVLVTLAGHAMAFGYDPETCGNIELARIQNVPKEQILKKNSEKPKFEYDSIRIDNKRPDDFGEQSIGIGGMKDD